MATHCLLDAVGILYSFMTFWATPPSSDVDLFEVYANKSYNVGTHRDYKSGYLHLPLLIDFIISPF